MNTIHDSVNMTSSDYGPDSISSMPPTITNDYGLRPFVTVSATTRMEYLNFLS